MMEFQKMHCFVTELLDHGSQNLRVDAMFTKSDQD